MSYIIEKTNIGTDIVISGWEEGIADSPYLGIADMRNVNIISIPKEVSVNFATQVMTTSPAVTTIATTIDTTLDTFTVSSTAGFYNGMAIIFNTIVTSTGFVINKVYWIGDLTSTTFKIYGNPARYSGTVVDVTGSNGSGTFSSITITNPIDKAIWNNTNYTPFHSYTFILDDSGRVWWINNTNNTPTNNLVYLGNTTLTGSTGRAIACFYQYLLVFRGTTIDYLDMTNIQDADFNFTGSPDNPGWNYSWTPSGGYLGLVRPVKFGRDAVLYWGKESALGSLLQVAGTVFTPSDTTTYTKTLSALTLPIDDTPISIGELGSKLLIGGKLNYIYPWDRVSTSFDYPLIVGENYISKIITSNSTSYIFAGNRGRIYQTNGSNVGFYKKVPDAIVNKNDPYFTWGDAVYWKNQLYFSFSTTDNQGTIIDTVGGVWAIDLVSSAFRHTTELSYGSLGGSTNMIVQNVLTANPAGAGLYVGWNYNSTYGVDAGTSLPYTGGQTYIESDIIPIGKFLSKMTFSNIEYKLSKLTVTGESVDIYQRSNLNTSYTLVPLTQGGTVGELSGVCTSNFENIQWIQIKAILTSTITTPTYCPLTQIILR